MTALLIILIVLAVLTLLCIIPLGARVLYDETGVTVLLVAGLLRFRVYPKKAAVPKPAAEEKKQKKQEKKAAEKAAKKAAKKAAGKKPKEKKPLGALLQEFLPLVKVGLHALGGLRTIFTVQKLKLRVTYGAEDAAAAARNYGLAWSVMGAGLALLGRAIRIKRQDVQAVLDYDCKEMRVTADAVVTLTLGRVFGYLIHYGAEALHVWNENKKKEKAVQQHESSSS